MIGILVHTPTYLKTIIPDSEKIYYYRKLFHISLIKYEKKHKLIKEGGKIGSQQ